MYQNFEGKKLIN